jgi:hypothetical protein
MAIAPDEDLTPAEARAATLAARQAAAAQNAADALAAENANIAESDARLRARISTSPNYVAPEAPIAPSGPVGGGDTGPTGPTGGGNPQDTDWTSSGNQAFYKGVPFTGMRNGLQFINGYRQDMYTPDGKERPTQGATGPVGGTTTSTLAERQNIFDQLTSLFTTYGVIKPGDPASDALLKTMKDLAMSGAGSDTISLALQQSTAYKTRFAGNEARRAAGLSVLSPAEYIATEKAYDQVLHAAGVPTGFYRGTDEMAKLIGADVSPTELQTRVDLAAKSIQNADPFYTQQLQNFYGLSQGDMIAHVLDPAVAAPLIQQQVSTSTIGAAAARNATNVNLSTAEQLAGMGITQAQAEAGFGNIAAQLPSMQAIASRYQGFGAASEVGQELQSATFNAPISGLTAAQSEQALKRLQTQEASAFGGSAGAAKGSLLGSEEGVS